MDTNVQITTQTAQYILITRVFSELAMSGDSGTPPHSFEVCRKSVWAERQHCMTFRYLGISMD